MSRRSPLWLFAALTTLAGTSPATAATFDLIWADHLIVTNPGIAGFSLSIDVALIVNKGPADITSSELSATTIRSSSSDPAVMIFAANENAGPLITPIHPNEAAGNVSAFNDVLTTKLLPDETLHDLAGGPVFSFLMRFPTTFLGSVVLDFTMTVGANQAQYSMLVDFVSGSSFTVAFPSASRVSSVPLATLAVPTTWGRLKSLYR